jgi:transposase
LERRRRRALGLLKQGETVTAVARRIGCSHSSVIAWRTAVRERGDAALAAKAVPGRPRKLTNAQLQRIPGFLARGAMAWGYSTDLWTTKRIAQVIERRFKVTFHRAHVGRLMARLDWSCQKPERRALERDERAIEHWKRYRWVAIKKKPNA